MGGVLRTFFGWALILAVGYGAIVIEWDEWNGRRVVDCVVHWRGWTAMKQWGAGVLHGLAFSLEKSAARSRRDRLQPVEELAKPTSLRRNRGLQGRGLDPGQLRPRYNDVYRDERREVYERWSSDTEKALDRLIENRQSLRRHR